MTEIIENLIQLVLLTGCTILSGIDAYRRRDLDGGILAMFFGSYVLGDAYWFLYLVFYHHTPDVFYVSYMSWYAAYLFMNLLLRRAATEEEMRTRHPALWLLPLFTAGMAVYYMQFGDYFGNVVTAVLMGMMLFHAARGLIHMRSNPQARCRRGLYITVILFCALEYCAWTASCIFEGDTPANPFYWFDFLLTPCIILFLPAYRKAVSA